MIDLNRLKNKQKKILKKFFFYPIILSFFSVIITGILIFIVIFIYEKNNREINIDRIYENKKNFLKTQVINLSNDISNVLKLNIEKTKIDLKNSMYDIQNQIIALTKLDLNNSEIIKYLNTLNLKYKKILVTDLNFSNFLVSSDKKIMSKNNFLDSLKNAEKNNGYFFYKQDNKHYIGYMKKYPKFKFVISIFENPLIIKKRLINDIFKRVKMKKFGKNNYFFILGTDGTLYVNPTFKKSLGKNIFYLKDKNGKNFIKEIINRALKNKNGAFLNYYWQNPSNNKTEKKLAYIIYNKDINAVIGSGLYYSSDIDFYIQKEKKNLKKEFFYINLTIFLVLLTILVVSILVSFYLSRKIKNIFNIYNNEIIDLLKKVNFEATHDSLTHIPNRKYFNKKLKEEIYRAQRYNIPFSLAIFDVDFFKKINDNYGHDIGDKVLKYLANFCKNKLRKSDVFARWGGEEFVVLLPHTKLNDAKVICEKIRNEIKKIDAPVKFTISCGITEYKKGDDIHSLFQRADKALYNAKRNGRDMIKII